MDQTESPKSDDDSSPGQKSDKRSQIGILILALLITFLYTNYDRGWIVLESGEAGYCRNVRQKVEQVCASADHDGCRRWQESLAKCQSDHR